MTGRLASKLHVPAQETLLNFSDITDDTKKLRDIVLEAGLNYNILFSLLPSGPRSGLLQDTIPTIP